MSGTDHPDHGGPSLVHLLGRLGIIEARVRLTVAARRADAPAAADPFRGLYLSDDQVDRLLSSAAAVAPPDGATADYEAGLESDADAAEADGAHLRLRSLARDFGLAPLDVELLLVAIAPDLDSRFERLYGFLHDDVTRRRASVGLALELAGLPPAAGAARQRLTPSGPLVAAGLVNVDEPDRPFLTRALSVPDRVTAHLLGDDSDDQDLLHVLAPATADAAPDPAGLARALAAGARLCYLREKPGSSGRSLAVAGLAAAGRPVVTLDLGRLGPNEDPLAIARIAMRDARLRGAGLVAGPIEALADRGIGPVRAFADPAASADGADVELAAPVLLIGRRSWEPSWSHDVPVLLDVEPPTSSDRADLWRSTLNGSAGGGLDAAEVTQHFRLTPEQVTRAARAARLQAVTAGAELALEHLRSGARAQNAAGLENLAKRIVPRVGWEDLVLPESTLHGLQELASRARNRERVIDEWGMRPGGGRGRGITGLFAGDSGTGKTMSAEVIAGVLGLDLYAINLATVVDKYVGETEKNLERIFSEADGINGVLLFDEADAIFGKRSEVRDAHDRYANIETAYLLQRMESFDGLALLSTNLRANLDDAFSRRLDAVIDFPLPDPEFREQLWERCLGSNIPRADDLDLAFAAQRFELSGGNIRSIAVTAAY
ncbi:MAG: ATP-binding protein, partial [Actinomycetota bacterium]|nr:ATP-binding protein [Actinomycetota bacterium]